TRAGVPEVLVDPAVYGFFLVAAAAATWGAWRMNRAGRPVDAFLLIALGVFTASPVAVTHHWSGIVIVLPLLLAPRRLPVRLGLAALALVHLIGTHYAYALTAESALEHQLQWTIGNAQGMTGIAVLVVLLIDAGLSGRPRAGLESDGDPDADRPDTAGPGRGWPGGAGSGCVSAGSDEARPGAVAAAAAPGCCCCSCWWAWPWPPRWAPGGTWATAWSRRCRSASTLRSRPGSACGRSFPSSRWTARSTRCVSPPPAMRPCRGST